MEREAFRAFGRVLAQGAKSIGTRAAAHAVKSVVKDGARVIKSAEKRFNSVLDKLEEMTSVEEPVDDEDTRG